MEVNGKIWSVFFCAWLVDKQYVLDTFFIFLCGMTSVLHREAVSIVKYCIIYIAQESHKRNTVVSEVQKSVECVTSWKRVGPWVSFEHCI